ncbi:DUF4179 domain-containing protein [Clostridium disporicum]|uniref:DUF4179 domain-containing protein n=1 Tax=Clostridium disporicum TaxID=84024 RepID=UPI003606A18E
MDNNIKDMIKIPKELDNAVLKGFEMGKREKKKEKQKLIFKRSAIAAGVIVAGTTMAGIINPDIVSAIPIVGDVFEYFSEGEYKQASNKYSELGKDVNLSVKDKGVKVTVNKVVVDDNLLIASLFVESDKLNGYDEVRSPQDFVNETMDILVNGQAPLGYGTNVTIVNDTTAAIILEADISELNLENEINIDLNISEFTRGEKTIAKGNWDFKINTIKGSEANTYEVNREMNLSNVNVEVEKLVITPLTNRVYFKGNSVKDNDSWLGDNDFIIKDNNGKILMSEFAGGHSDVDTNYWYQYNILNDLSNTEYIEIIKADGNEIIEDENEYLLKASSVDESSANRSNEVISRKPTKEELNDGYALNSVSYNVDIDKNTAFESVDSLIGKEIVVNNTDKIIVKDIIAHDDYTEVVMKIDGNYNYRLLSSIVLFDEDMNDACAFEGAMTTLNDIEEKVVTVKLTKIDPSKRYTIAIPVTTDLVIDESEKVTINLK